MDILCCDICIRFILVYHAESKSISLRIVASGRTFKMTGIGAGVVKELIWYTVWIV